MKTASKGPARREPAVPASQTTGGPQAGRWAAQVADSPRQAAQRQAISRLGLGAGGSTGPIQLKKVFGTDGRIRDEPDDYVLLPGETEAQAPNREELEQRQSGFREALGQPTPLTEKFAFPFTHFDEAFPVEHETKDQDLGKNRTLASVEVHRRSDTASAVDLLALLPKSFLHEGHTQRLLNAPDPSSTGRSSPPGPVTIERLREVLTGLQYAQSKGIDPSQVNRSTSASVDFEGSVGGTKEYFDPFTSPQPRKPTWQNLRGDAIRARDEPSKFPQFEPWQPNDQDRTRWARGTYAKHTNNSKQFPPGAKTSVTNGKDVWGLWDQTSETSAEIEALKAARGPNSTSKDKVVHMDLQLDLAYAIEDHLAAQQIAHAKRLREQTPEEKKEEQSTSTKQQRTADPAQEWGGRTPAETYSPWGRNHPLNPRHRGPEDDTGEGAI